MVHNKADPAVWERSFECSAIGVPRRRQKNPAAQHAAGIRKKPVRYFTLE